MKKVDSPKENTAKGNKDADEDGRPGLARLVSWTLDELHRG